MINWDIWEALKKGWERHDRIIVGLFYYHPGAGNGDWLYNTARCIILLHDLDDEWAHQSIEAIFECLASGKRWPDEYKEYIKPGLWGNQFNVTQDPWILAYCAAVHLRRYDLIEKYKPSFWDLPIFFDKYSWRRKLLKKPNFYWFWRELIPYRILQHFVYVFYGYMELAVEWSKEHYKEELLGESLKNVKDSVNN